MIVETQASVFVLLYFMLFDFFAGAAHKLCPRPSGSEFWFGGKIFESKPGRGAQRSLRFLRLFWGGESSGFKVGVPSVVQSESTGSDLLVFPFWSIFSHGHKRLTF